MYKGVENLLADASINQEILGKIALKFVSSNDFEYRFIYDKVLEYNKIKDNIDLCVDLAVTCFIRQHQKFNAEFKKLFIMKQV